MNTFPLTVASPDGNLFHGEAVQLTLRGSEGDLAVAPRRGENRGGAEADHRGNVGNALRRFRRQKSGRNGRKKDNLLIQGNNISKNLVGPVWVC